MAAATNLIAHASGLGTRTGAALVVDGERTAWIGDAAAAAGAA